MQMNTIIQMEVKFDMKWKRLTKTDFCRYIYEQIKIKYFSALASDFWLIFWYSNILRFETVVHSVFINSLCQASEWQWVTVTNYQYCYKNAYRPIALSV